MFRADASRLSRRRRVAIALALFGVVWVPLMSWNFNYGWMAVEATQ